MSLHAPLILDIASTSLTTTDKKRLSHPLVGGVILFSRNWVDRKQLTRLCRSIKAIRSDLLICVDHEGGRVQRFKTDGFTHIPPMGHLGIYWQQDPLYASDLATQWAYVLASELRACGVDLSFTPVLDLYFNRSDIIGDRAFHKDPRVVSILSKALMHGLLQAGMRNCGKHFPGHGYVRADSHIAIPLDQRALHNILDNDAKPYVWLNSTLSSVMPAHVVYSQVDSLPAGFSRKWLQDILRDQLDFQGAVISDDLSMVGARSLHGQAVSYTESAIAALNAGCDLLLLCNESTKNQGKAIDGILLGLSHTLSKTSPRHTSKKQKTDQWQANPVSEQRRRALLPNTQAPSWEQLMQDAYYQQCRRHMSQAPKISKK